MTMFDHMFVIHNIQSIFTVDVTALALDICKTSSCENVSVNKSN